MGVVVAEKRLDTMAKRYGCLTLLGLFAVIVSVAVWTTDDPPDHGAAITMMGLFGLVVVYAGGAIERLTTKGEREARGFPMEPTRPENEE
jgi:hypothetical protein